MKKRLQLLLLIVLLAGSVVIVDSAKPASPPAAKTIVLKQSIYSPAGHPYTERAYVLAERVAAATEGRVKIETYPGASLCPAKEELAAAHAGTIDVTQTIMTYLVGMVPLLNYAGLPWGPPPTPETSIKATSEIKPFIVKALKRYNVHYLCNDYNAGINCIVTRKEVRTPADLKGMKVRTAGGFNEAIAINWGAATVSLPATQVYTALQRGTVDATIFTVPSVKGFKLYEVASYVTDIAMGMSGQFVCVNKDKWQQISKADQKAIEDLIPEYVLWVSEKNRETFKKCRAEWPELGIKVYVPTPAEMKLWKAAAIPIWDKYASGSPEGKKIVEILLKYGGGVK